MATQHYDLIVIGSGSGLDVAVACAQHGLTVAIIEEGPMGGTCLNRGCIPSKMYIHTADVAQAITEAAKFGIQAKITKINFQAIVKRVRGWVDSDAAAIEASYQGVSSPKLYKGHAEFIDEKTIKVGRFLIKSNKVLIAAGARTAIPPIPGLDKIPYLTSESALRPKKLPKTLTIIGGGYIAAELAHFFGALGSKVTIIEVGALLLAREDKQIAETFTKLFSKRHTVLLGYGVTEVVRRNGEYTVTATPQDRPDPASLAGRRQAGKKHRKIVRSEELLVATGIKPNSDTLKVEKTGVKTNDRGFIEANDYLETNIKGIFTLGDIHGRFVFKHSANHEAGYAIRNILNPTNMLKVDYTAMPHAIFTSPQIAGVGATEQELIEKKLRYRVARWDYQNTAMGEALLERDGFVKFLYEPKSLKILGCHIIGPEASTLIHEVLIAMKAGDGTLRSITKTVHIHPALSEVVQRAAGNIQKN